MKNIVPAVVLFFALFPRVVLCDDTQFTLSPAKPKSGDQLMLRYNSASRSATLRDARGITGEVMLVSAAGLPVLVEVPLKHEGNFWSGSFSLPDKDIALLLIRFTSGENTDDNGANVWDAMVYGTDGTPVRNAHLLRSSILRGRSVMEFKHSKDPEAAKKEIAAEEEAYPDNLEATTTRWGMMMRETPGDATLSKIKQELESIYASKKNDEGSVSSLLYWFETTGQKQRADEIRAAAIAANPRGKIAYADAQRQTYTEQDSRKRCVLLQKLNADFPATGQDLEIRMGVLTSALVAVGEYDKAAATLASMPNPSGDAYNNLAWEMIDKGVDIEKALGYAETGIGILRKRGGEGKPPYIAEPQWQKMKKQSLGMILDAYGYGLFKLNRLEKAVAAYEEATSLTEGKFPDITGRLIECSDKLGHTDRVLELTTEALSTGNSSEAIVSAYKSAYVKKHGSDKGLDASIADMKTKAAGKARADLMKDRVNKPAIDFSLRSLDGKMMKLSDLKGKVVVLDFWATWCGPCKYSFPYLQKVYDKYKGNDRVMILTMDTWENVTGKERESLVKKFIDDNKYTLPVLFDEGFVEKYGVEGIPTKFVIDRKGIIQFKKIGAEGEEMLKNLSAQIDLLLSEEFYSM